MKKLVLLLALTAIVSCKEEPKDYALISGKIENADLKIAVVSDGDFEREISIAEDGTFTDTLQIKKSKYYNFTWGSNSAKIYIAQDDHIKLDTRADDFSKSLQFSGDNAEENHYLITKKRLDVRTEENARAIYSLEETAFTDSLNSFEAEALNKLKRVKNASSEFIDFETNNLKYEKLSVYKDYRNAHAYFTQNNDFDISEGFLPLEMTQGFDDEQLYDTSAPYKKLAIDKTIDDIYTSLESTGSVNAVNPEDLSVINDIKIQALKDDVINVVGNMFLSPANDNMSELYAFFNKNIVDKKVKENINQAYKKNKKLLKGMPSPKFVNYENNAGGETSLDDLKGKYVYIDVWATWCGPCIGEIPSLKKVEQKYHGKNIEFVSTSIDTPNAYDKWKAMIKAKELGGTQVLADNNWQSQFVQDYAIDGIPRFILVDPKGNIVSADAPRPSNPELVKLLDKELAIKAK